MVLSQDDGNRSRLGRPDRYGYDMHFGEFQGEEALGGTTDIIKYDFARDSAALLALERGVHSDEVVFVPAADGTAEDDGYLMGFEHDARANASHLAVYDAKDLVRVARVRIPFRVPAGFHGLWVPS